VVTLPYVFADELRAPEHQRLARAFALSGNHLRAVPSLNGVRTTREGSRARVAR
jgi:hypothetical protein